MHHVIRYSGSNPFLRHIYFQCIYGNIHTKQHSGPLVGMMIVCWIMVKSPDSWLLYIKSFMWEKV